MTIARRKPGRRPALLASRFLPLTLLFFVLAVPPAFGQRAFTAEDGELIVSPGATNDAIAALTEKYRETGRAEVLRQSNRIIYPYGHSQPVLSCAQLRTCAVKLQPGEVVMGVSPGDPVRWAIEQTYMGPNGQTPVLLVKPNADDITTNLVVTTNRRMYHLTLDSPPAPEGTETNPQGDYTREVSYYYPDQMLQLEKNAEQHRQRQRQQRRNNAVPVSAGVSLEELDFDYTWDKGADFPWVPNHVFDDGQHVYIKIPPEARSAAAPLLFQIGPGEERKILNYSIRNNFYITDRVFDKAALVIGVEERTGFLGLGGKERVEKSLTIINRGSAQ